MAGAMLLGLALSVSAQSMPDRPLLVRDARCGNYRIHWQQPPDKEDVGETFFDNAPQHACSIYVLPGKEEHGVLFHELTHIALYNDCRFHDLDGSCNDHLGSDEDFIESVQDTLPQILHDNPDVARYILEGR